MATKIQINNLEALERLIGNDNELEMDIRQSVVESFTRKHLKTIANEELINKTAKAIVQQVSDEYLTTVKGTWNSTNVLKPEVKEKLNEYISSCVELQVRELIYEAIGRDKILEKLQETLNRCVERVVSTLEPQLIEERLNKMVDKRLKERLGLA